MRPKISVLITSRIFTDFSILFFILVQKLCHLTVWKKIETIGISIGCKYNWGIFFSEQSIARPKKPRIRDSLEKYTKWGNSNLLNGSTLILCVAGDKKQIKKRILRAQRKDFECTNLNGIMEKRVIQIVRICSFFVLSTSVLKTLKATPKIYIFFFVLNWNIRNFEPLSLFIFVSRLKWLAGSKLLLKHFLRFA